MGQPNNLYQQPTVVRTDNLDTETPQNIFFQATEGSKSFSSLEQILEYLKGVKNTKTAEQVAQSLRIIIENTKKEGYFLTKNA